MNIRPPSPTTTEPEPPPSTNLSACNQDETNSYTQLSLIQLNCHRSKPVLLQLLSQQHHHLLLIQEPWVNPHTLSAPTHPAWHLIMPLGFTPSEEDKRPKSCIYISRSLPTESYTPIPSGSGLLTAVEIRGPYAIGPLRVISLYNPPTSFTGLPVLEHWMKQHHRCRTPTLLTMDGNLHHKQWNPPYRRQVHRQALVLTGLCGSNGFKLVSPKGIPTYYPPKGNGGGTTIDLTWSNFALAKQVMRCEVLSNTFGSDHQAVSTILDFSPPQSLPSHNNTKIANLDLFSFVTDIDRSLSTSHVNTDTTEGVDGLVENITTSITNAFHRQGKEVTTNPKRQKLWWDKAILDPIIKNRNRARRWMIQSQDPQARACYLKWQAYFRGQIAHLQNTHWKTFLASCTGAQTYHAFSYTKPFTSAEVLPLYRQDRTLASSKSEQADLLFNGTSVAKTIADLSDIQPRLDDQHIDPSIEHPPIVTHHEIETIINDLPNKKAVEPDGIAN